MPAADRINGHIAGPAAGGPRQVDAKSLLALVIRRKWLILGIAVPIMAVSALVTLRSAETVTATSRLMVIGAEPENPEFRQLAPNWDMVMGTAVQVATSIPVMKKAADALEDTLANYRSRDPKFPVFLSRAGLVNALGRGVGARQAGESNILAINFTSTSAEFALLAADAITRSYIDVNIRTQQNTPAVEYYGEQIRTVQAEIDSLLQERAVIVETSGGWGSEESSDRDMGQIRTLESALFNVRTERMSVEERLTSVEAAIVQDPQYIPVSSRGEAMYFGELRGRYDAAVAKMVQLRSQYREGSGFMERQQVVVDGLWQELSRVRANYLEDLRIAAAQLRSKERGYEEAIEQQMAKIRGMPEVQRKIESHQMRIESREELLEALQFKYGEVRLKAMTDSRISNLLVLDQPFIDAAVVGGKKYLYLVFAMAFSLVLGLACAWFVDNQDHRLFDRDQTERSLGVPVLGAISAEQPVKKSRWIG